MKLIALIIITYIGITLVERAYRFAEDYFVEQVRDIGIIFILTLLIIGAKAMVGI